MIWHIVLWVCIGVNIVTCIVNVRNMIKLREARRAAEMVGEAYAKALEALIKSENIREN